MKLKTEEINIQSGGVKTSQKFGIRNIGFILSILRSKMYRSPIEAICREISSNCIDANRLTGKQNIPIEIRLPNSFNSNIEFKDFGPGIDLNLMEDIFLNYGESTKRGGNEDIGGFGLGAKTPFSYSDVFNITTIAADRVKRTYAAIIDQTQQGELNLLSEVLADESESTGTIISVPVKREDFKAFTDAIIKYTKYWEVRPKLSGQNPLPEYPKMTELISGSNWKIFDSSTVGFGYNEENSLVVIIAGVPFEIDLSEIKQADWPADFWKKYSQLDFRRLRELGLHIYVPNGELTIAASRDSLYFDDETKKKLAIYINNALSEIGVKFKEKINSFQEYRAANHFIQNIYNCTQFYQIDRLLNSNSQDLEWQGKKLNRKGFSSASFGQYARLVTYQKSKISESGFEIVKQVGLNLSENVFLIHDDTLKSTVPATVISKIFSENPEQNLIQILFTPQRPNNAEWRRAEESGDGDPPQYKTDLIQDLGFEKLSEVLEGNFRRRDFVRKTSGEKKVQIYDMVGGKLKPRRVPVSSEMKGYYIDIVPGSRRNSFSFFLGEKKFLSPAQSGWLPLLMSFLELSGSGEEQIYFLPPKTAPKLPGLVSIEEKLKQKLLQVDWKAVTDISELARKKYHYESIFREFYSDFAEFQTVIATKIVDQKQSLFYQFAEKYNQFLKQEENFNAQVELFHSIEVSYLQSIGCDAEHHNSKSTTELDLLIKKINDQYPMLFRNNLNYSSVHRPKFVARYINLVDWIKSQPNLSLPFSI